MTRTWYERVDLYVQSTDNDTTEKDKNICYLVGLPGPFPYCRAW